VSLSLETFLPVEYSTETGKNCLLIRNILGEAENLGGERSIERHGELSHGRCILGRQSQIKLGVLSAYDADNLTPSEVTVINDEALVFALRQGRRCDGQNVCLCDISDVDQLR